MQKVTVLLLITILFGACARISPNRQILVLDLDSGWNFRQAGSTDWLPATVPGTVHTDLMANGRISDPYYRLNETDVQWIDKTSWEYMVTFTPDREILNRKHQELVFFGLDTYADVYLNGQLLFKADNMFRTWKADCSGIITNGDNTLSILFHSPTAEGLKLLESNGFQLPADNDQSEIGGMGEKKVSPFIRKAPYHFGWDWGPRLVTSGVWRPVRLEAWDGIRFDNLYVRISEVGETRAELLLEVGIQSDMAAGVPVDVYVDEVKVKTERIPVQIGRNVATFPITIKDPELWWPNGMGKQKLYTIRCELPGKQGPVDRIETKTGIRKIQLVQQVDPDSLGSSFYFEVNGEPVFAKGANYIPNDLFLPRVSPQKYEHILQSAVMAHMNMIRVWGGGVYEDDLFYDLCDRYGLLVWQDFMFACAMVPGDSAYLENVRMEAIDNVKRLRNHPSVALWCGNNEIEVAWAEWEENRGWGWKQRHDSLQRKAIWKAYDTLFHRILPEVVATYQPDIAYWPSSPSAGPGKLAGYDTRSGDMHYWGVWHGLHPFSDFRKYRARFMSEYGFQSFPEFNSVKKYTLPGDWDIQSEVMMAHQRSGIGNLRIRQYMETRYVIPDDFEDFLYVGQLLQAEAIKMAIESHRADKPYCMGTLYWQLNDCWPVASWSGIDYYGQWKALQYFVKESFKPVILAVGEDEGSTRVHIVSDLQADVAGELNLQWIRFDGTLLRQDSILVKILNNSSSVYYENALDNFDPLATVMVATLHSGDTLCDSEYHYFAPLKELKLPDPGIKLTVSEAEGVYLVTMTSTNLARNVFLSVDGSEGRFSDNFFDLLPGEEYKVSFPKSCTLEDFKGRLKIIHLQQTL